VNTSIISRIQHIELIVLIYVI